MRSAEAPRPFVVVENPIKSDAISPPVTPLAKTRTLYEKCPLCDGEDIPYQIEAKVTNHPLYKPQLPPTMKWRGCASCGHVFTEGYFTPEACEIIFSSTHGHQKVGNDAEGQRKVSAKMVERVARYVPGGDWLDIGVGNGSLLFTAAEWGFGAVGTDLRTENVTKAQEPRVRGLCRRHREHRSSRSLQRREHGRRPRARAVSEALACRRASHDAARAGRSLSRCRTWIRSSGGHSMARVPTPIGGSSSTTTTLRGPVSCGFLNPKASNSPSTTSANAIAAVWKSLR